MTFHQVSLCYFRLLIRLLHLPLEYIQSLFCVSLRFACKLFWLCIKLSTLVWTVHFYVFFRDKTFSGVSVDTKHNTPTEVLYSFTCVIGIFLGICMVVAYVYFIHYHRHCINRNVLQSTSFKDGVPWFATVQLTMRNSIFAEQSDSKSSNIENW